MKSAVKFLVEELEQSILMTSSVKTTIKQAKEMEENLAEQFAEFSILCDRREMNPVKFKDWLKQYNEKT
jgi:hypothetical protein